MKRHYGRILQVMELTNLDLVPVPNTSMVRWAVDGGLPIDGLRLHAGTVATIAASALPESLNEIVDEACRLGTSNEGSVMLEALLSRCSRAHQLLDEYLDLLGERP